MAELTVTHRSGCAVSVRGAVKPDVVGAHRLRDILEILLAAIVIVDVELAENLVVHLADTQMPPGWAMLSSRAAMLMPSPKMRFRQR